jgi:hypothetical protein
MVKIDAVRIWARTGLLFATTVNSFAAVPVENLTAEKLGIPAEDFISPEEAKKIAAPLRDPLAGDYVVENAIIFPWLIESRDNYEPEIIMGFYEVTVYSGKERYATYDALDAKVEEYLRSTDPLVYVRDGAWHVEPRDLLSRDDLTHELFGDADVVTYWVPINKKFGQKRSSWGDSEVGWNTLMLHICSTVGSKVDPGGNPTYETTICFSGAVQFMVFRTNGDRIFIQTSDIHNRFRVFTSEAGFDGYFNANVATINLETNRY